MTVQDYLEMVRGIKRGESTQILNFGLANSKWTTLKESEGTDKPVKKRDYMFDIENAKRLLPSTCQDKPASGQARLYQLLESNMQKYENDKDQKQIKQQENELEFDYDPTSAGDLMFQTEVDVVQRKPKREKSVVFEDSLRLEERLDIEHAE